MPNEPIPATPPDDETPDQRRLREHDEAEDRRRLAAERGGAATREAGRRPTV